MLVVDIGNTNIVIGIYYKKKLNKTVRLKTKDKQLINQLKKILRPNKFKTLKLDKKNCIISSVSNYSEKKIINFFKKNKFIILNINLDNVPKRIEFNYVKNQLGADRIANSFAALNKFGENSLVIDFGTATTFDLIINSKYEGGLIAPGISISHNALIENASKLRKILITKTNKVIGNDTKQSMRSGFYWGYTSLINGIIKKIINEKKIKPIIILTGGLSSIFKDEIKYRTYNEPNLTLDGLYLIGQEKYEK